MKKRFALFFASLPTIDNLRLHIYAKEPLNSEEISKYIFDLWYAKVADLCGKYIPTETMKKYQVEKLKDYIKYSLPGAPIKAFKAYFALRNDIRQFMKTYTIEFRLSGAGSYYFLPEKYFLLARNLIDRINYVISDINNCIQKANSILTQEEVCKLGFCHKIAYIHSLNLLRSTNIIFLPIHLDDEILKENAVREVSEEQKKWIAILTQTENE